MPGAPQINTGRTVATFSSTSIEEYASVQETQAKHSQELLDGLKAKAENPDFIVNQSWEKIIDIAYVENIRSLAYESI